MSAPNETPGEAVDSQSTAPEASSAEPAVSEARRPGSAPEQGSASTPGSAPEQGSASTPGSAPEQETVPGPTATGEMPEYKGEPLDSERGPGLGCFWIQIALLTFFLIFTPLTVTWGWDPFISGALLIFTLILLLFSGQTIIFLLRLVAADRRTRRTPLDPTAKPTVGQMEEVGSKAAAGAAPTDDAAAAAPESSSQSTSLEKPDGERQHG